jgi:hypothetical protein
MKTIKVKVNDLMIGDKLLGSGAIITSAPYDSIDCPRGKTNVGVQYPGDDKSFRRTWHKRTEIKVERNEK